MRYIVKHMNNGDIGVYDTERASFPVETPELRAAGVKRLELWLRGGEGLAEAERVAALLNDLPENMGKVSKAVKKMGKAAQDAEEASLRKVADALIESEREARASVNA